MSDDWPDLEFPGPMSTLSQGTILGLVAEGRATIAPIRRSVATPELDEATVTRMAEAEIEHLHADARTRMQAIADAMFHVK